MKNLSVVVREIDWLNGGEFIHPIRRTVFIEEQGVSEDEEWDEHDHASTHFLATHSETGEPLGTARLLPNGKLTRMAVLKPWRSHGAGRALLQAAQAAARRNGIKEIVLDAQIGAIAFYERHGFNAFGPVFLDAGIEHRKMQLAL